MMDRRTATRLSKFLSLVLRHRPDDYGLAMDEQGWVDFESLIDVLVAEDIVAETAEADVMELVEGSERRRFQVDGNRIRALYGHSARIRLDYPPDDPPAVLWHGTTPEHAARVRGEGLKPEGRAFVHLSSTEEEARAVGARHTDAPVLVRVDARGALERGVTFHQATELIWLCPALDADVCAVPDELPESHPRPARVAPPRAPRPETGRPPVPEPVAESGEFRRRTRKKGSRR
jgi:putative RNA 2'-phosphotransferase